MEKYVLDDDQLDKTVGGESEPEEFDWKANGQNTPVKDDKNTSEWKFEAIGDVNGNYEKITGGTTFNQSIDFSRIIQLLRNCSNIVNLSIIEAIVDALVKYGKNTAITLAKKLISNDETSLKKIIEIINNN